MYITYHWICDTTRQQSFTQKKLIPTQYAQVARAPLPPPHTHIHTHIHTHNINTSTPTEASNHKQYTQARTRGNVLGRYRTLLRQVPDFSFFHAENEIMK